MVWVLGPHQQAFFSFYKLKPPDYEKGDSWKTDIAGTLWLAGWEDTGLIGVYGPKSRRNLASGSKKGRWATTGYYKGKTGLVKGIRSVYFEKCHQLADKPFQLHNPVKAWQTFERVPWKSTCGPGGHRFAGSFVPGSSNRPVQWPLPPPGWRARAMLYKDHDALSPKYFLIGLYASSTYFAPLALKKLA